MVGLHRGLAGAAQCRRGADALRIEVQEVHDGHPDDEHTDELVARVPRRGRGDPRAARRRRAHRRLPALGRGARARWPTPPGFSPDLSREQKLRLLETLDVTARLELAVELQRERLAELQVRSKIRDDVESGAQKQQREYFLRKQMESIRKELGEDEADLIDEYEHKIAEAEMPEAVAEQAEKELRRLERQGEQSPESSMIRSYLDWLIAVPWSKRSEERLDPVAHPRGARRRPRRPR